MTSNHERAEKIGKKAVSDDYIEDGGYIRDWLVADILAELDAACAEGEKKANDFAAMRVIEVNKEAVDLAVKCAVEAERERCAKIAESNIKYPGCQQWDERQQTIARRIVEQIRAGVARQDDSQGRPE